MQQADVFQINTYKKKPCVHCLISKVQTDSVREQLVNIVEHLAAKEPKISLRTWWRPKTELKEEGVLLRNTTLINVDASP